MVSNTAAPAGRARILVGVDVSYFTTDGALAAAGYFSRAFMTTDGRTVRGAHIASYIRGLRDNGGPGSLPGLGGAKEAGWEGSILLLCPQAVPAMTLVYGTKAIDYGALELAQLEELTALQEYYAGSNSPDGRAARNSKQKPVFTYPAGYEFSLCFNHACRTAEVLWGDGAHALVRFLKWDTATCLRLYRGPREDEDPDNYVEYRTVTQTTAPSWLLNKLNENNVVL